MDFLDPKATKKHRFRLMLGYGLMGILIIISSIILVFQAYGFNVDRQTGEVIQKSLVYVDSAPSNASVYLNGKLQSKSTNARFSVAEGRYDLLIKKEGYRDWKETFSVKGGEVLRITYPLLILDELNPNVVANFGTKNPELVSQSPDRRWLLFSTNKSIYDFVSFDLQSFENDQNVIPRQENLSFPKSIFTQSPGEHSIKVVEWSNDNQNFLVKHSFGDSYEFLILNRDDVTKSVNLNNLLNQNPSKVTLRDKKSDEWFLYNSRNKTLLAYNKSGDILQSVDNVVDYKTHDASTILYSRINGKNKDVFLLSDKKNYQINSVKNGQLHLDLAKFKDDWFVVVGSVANKKTYVFKNPAQYLSKKENQNMKPVPVSVQQIANLSDVSFSTNTRFVMSQGGQNVRVYDAEKDESYVYKLSSKLDSGSKVKWMDGHRMIFKSKGKVTMLTFDNSNLTRLLNTTSSDRVYFDRDYVTMYNLQKTTSGTNANFNLLSTDLRLDSDK